MIIESRKTGKQHKVDNKTWEAMQENDTARNFKVIDSTFKPEVITKSEMPLEIKDFLIEKQTVEKITKSETKEKQKSKKK